VIAYSRQKLDFLFYVKAVKNIYLLGLGITPHSINPLTEKIGTLKNLWDIPIPMTLKVTRKEFYLVIAFAIAGFIFTSPQYIDYRMGFNPLAGLLIYYALLFITLIILSKLSLIRWSINMGNTKELIGGILILFSFFIITDWMSISELPEESTEFTQSEAGAVLYFWHNFIGITDFSQLRILAFIITPAIFSFIGLYLTVGKLEL